MTGGLLSLKIKFLGYLETHIKNLHIYLSENHINEEDFTNAYKIISALITINKKLGASVCLFIVISKLYRPELLTFFKIFLKHGIETEYVYAKYLYEIFSRVSG